MVFASRLLQDIQEIMGDGTQKSYEELLDLRSIVHTQLDIEEDGKVSYARGSQWDFNMDLMKIQITLYNSCTWLDWIPMMKAQHPKKSPVMAKNNQFYRTLAELDQAFPQMAKQRE